MAGLDPLEATALEWLQQPGHRTGVVVVTYADERCTTIPDGDLEDAKPLVELPQLPLSRPASSLRRRLFRMSDVPRLMGSPQLMAHLTSAAKEACPDRIVTLFTLYDRALEGVDTGTRKRRRKLQTAETGHCNAP